MQKNIKLLVIGSIILGIGIVISSVSMVALESIVIDGGVAALSSNIDPGQSTKGVIPIKDDTSELHIAIHTEPSESSMQVQITSRDGSFSWKEEFNGILTQKIKIPETNDSLDYSITNNGDSSTYMSASLSGGDILENEAVTYGILLLVGGGILIAGIAVAIIGGISYLKGRKNTPVESA